MCEKAQDTFETNHDRPCFYLVCAGLDCPSLDHFQDPEPSHLKLTSDRDQASLAEASRSPRRSPNTARPSCTTISLGVETAAV